MALSDSEKMDVLVVGGGLAGLSLARHLARSGVDFQLVERRNRFGGRIRTVTNGAGYFDLGPAWFWPGQPRIAQLIHELGLQIFEQYSTGALSFEDEQGRVERGRGFASMQGSLRLQGGLSALVQSLVDELPAERLHRDTRVVRVLEDGVELETGQRTITLRAEKTVFALPPRLVEDAITFEPDLDPAARHAMKTIPTWMAGQAKAVAIYERPFWRDAGLSGDAMSRRGPLVEIHDASPAQDGPYALFGFIGVPPQGRRDQDALIVAVRDQLQRLFGDDAARPIDIVVSDWAFDPATSTADDLAPLYAHPAYGMPAAVSALAKRGLLFCGSEVAPGFGGYLEGALEAAQLAAAGLAAPDSATNETIAQM